MTSDHHDLPGTHGDEKPAHHKRHHHKDLAHPADEPHEPINQKPIDQKNGSADADADLRIADLTDTLKRLQAEFENYRKRTEQQQNEYAKWCDAQAIAALLPLIDDLELALGNAEQAIKQGSFYKGVEMIFAKMNDLLRSKGISVIDPAGKPFDARTHEALLTEVSDQPAGTVIEVLQKGYALGERVLRPAKVKIAKQA